ncbi:MAG: methyltransferase domain-containing protein [Candidatus Omnitrophota bacterium]
MSGKKDKNKKLHVGCGENNINGWINADLQSNIADIELDARKTFPFRKNSISYIYNEHFIEHLTKNEGVFFLSECYRILKPNGILRISTPNLRWLAMRYLNKELIAIGGWKPKSPCDMFNEAMKLWGHQYVYDEDQLTFALMNAGFKNVYPCKYKESKDKNLDSIENRPFNNELIYEAVK